MSEFETKTPVNSPTSGPQGGIINEIELNRANQILQDYRSGKKPIDDRIEEAERWWLLKQWEVLDKNADGSSAGVYGARRTASAWLFNAVVSSQADAVEAYPEPIILPREQGDEEEAKTLNSILPVIMQQNDFEETYSKCQWQKHKSGTGAYGTFWDKSKLNGLGDIAIRKVNMLNLFYQPGVDDIQASANLFHTEMMDRKYLLSKYPFLKDKILQTFTNSVKPKTEERVKTEDLIEVVDWYYHRENMNGQTALHYVKYVGVTPIYATENDLEPTLDEAGQLERDAPAVTGLYDDAEYPFDLDPLYPIDGSPTGLGMVYIGKGVQENIDRLSQKVIEAAILAATIRYFSFNNSINEAEFADTSIPIVHVVGSNGKEDLQQIPPPILDGTCVQIRNDLIEELKQTLGMTDLAMGQAPSGVVAAAALAIMDENAGKPRRASSRGSYRMYGRLITRVIERIRQFYDAPRTFRITGEGGKKEYISYDNQNLTMRPQQGEPDLFQKPVFDVEVRAQKANAYTKMSQNEMAIQFFQMGIFNPQVADQAIKMIELMDFKDREKIIAQIKETMMLIDQLRKYQELALTLTAAYNPQMVQPMLAEIAATDPAAAQQLQMTIQGQAALAKKNDNLSVQQGEAPTVRQARANTQQSGQPV